MTNKIKGIRKVAGETKHLGGYYSPAYLQLFYDTVTNECWTAFHSSIGHNSWTKYDNENILDCGFLVDQMTMNEIEQRIIEKIRERKIIEARQEV